MTTRERQLKQRIVPITDALTTPPALELPGEALTSGHSIFVDGLGVAKRQEVLLVSPGLRNTPFGMRYAGQLTGAASVRAAV